MYKKALAITKNIIYNERISKQGKERKQMELLNAILVGLPIYTLIRSIICLISQVREDRKNGIIKNIWEY